MRERVNRTLKPLIAIYAQQQQHHSWHIEIQKLAFAIRTAINETTGETPAFMMFGRDPRGPLDLLIGETIEEPNLTAVHHVSIQEYKKTLINNLRSAFNVIREHAEIEKIKQKKYDQHTTQRQFNEGDLVWVAIPKVQIRENPMGGKLQSNYQGQCRLTQQLSPNTFVVRRLSDNVNLGATNIDRLKLYIELTRNGQTTTSNRKDEPVPHDTERQKMKKNEPPMHDQSPKRRVSNRHRRVPIRHVEN